MSHPCIKENILMEMQQDSKEVKESLTQFKLRELTLSNTLNNVNTTLLGLQETIKSLTEFKIQQETINAIEDKQKNSSKVIWMFGIGQVVLILIAIATLIFKYE